MLHGEKVHHLHSSDGDWRTHDQRFRQAIASGGRGADWCAFIIDLALEAKPAGLWNSMPKSSIHSNPFIPITHLPLAPDSRPLALSVVTNPFPKVSASITMQDAYVQGVAVARSPTRARPAAAFLL